MDRVFLQVVLARLKTSSLHRPVQIHFIKVYITCSRAKSIEALSCSFALPAQGQDVGDTVLTNSIPVAMLTISLEHFIDDDTAHLR